jgi:hypothetical protein
MRWLGKFGEFGLLLNLEEKYLLKRFDRSTSVHMGSLSQLKTPAARYSLK